MTISDKEIAETVRRDKERGFRLLLQKYEEPIYWHLRRLLSLHDDAMDVAQDTFVRAFRSFSQLKDAASLRAWIYRIATHEALRALEMRKRPARLTESLDDSGADIVADGYVDYADAETVKLQNAILSLPPKQQAVFNMRYYDDMAYGEIARVTDTTEAGVRVNYHLAKEKIIKYINGHS